MPRNNKMRLFFLRFFIIMRAGYENDSFRDTYKRRANSWDF